MVVFCMMNDLCPQGKRAKPRPGEILTETQQVSVTYLAKVMCRVPNSMFIGPGAGRFWKAHASFDIEADAMLGVLNNYGINHMNINDQIPNMEKRDSFHFSNTIVNKKILTQI